MRGIPIFIIAGDLFQLKPVKAQTMYAGELDADAKIAEHMDYNKGHISPMMRAKIVDMVEAHNEGCKILKVFFNQAIVLTENVRQKDDVAFRHILHSVRYGKVTEQQRQILLKKVITDAERLLPPWNTCKRYFGKKVDVLVSNRQMIHNNCGDETELFDASPFMMAGGGMQVSHQDIAKAGCKALSEKLEPVSLTNGTPVIVSFNISQGKKFMVHNGTQATVVGYIAANKNHADYILLKLTYPPSNLPKLVIHDENGNLLKTMEHVWPLARIQGNFTFTYNRDRPDPKNPNKMIKRKEKMRHRISYFPLLVSHALTIHKAQGQTEKYAIIDLSAAFDPHMPYVALSRVCTLDGLRLQTPPTLKVLNAIRTSGGGKALAQIRTEMTRLKELHREVMEGLGYGLEDDHIQEMLEMEGFGDMWE